MSAEKKAIEEMAKAMGACPMDCDPCDGKCKYFSNTEQEMLEEMAQVLETAKIKALATIGSLNNGFGEWYAKALYNAGYRKADEVRKETAREILSQIDKILKRNHICSVLGEIDELAKKFGVEVEE